MESVRHSISFSMQDGRDGVPILDTTVSVPVSWKVGKECDDKISRTCFQSCSSKLDWRDLNIVSIVVKKLGVHLDNCVLLGRRKTFLVLYFMNIKAYFLV